MQEVKVKHSGEIIQLGRQGENLARRAVFDLTNWQALYGEGVAELICQRPGEDSVYPVAITQDGPAAIWEITDTDTTRPGVGHCELRYYVDETLAKSEIWMTKITKAMEGNLLSPPAPGQSWADQVLQAGAAAVEAAEKAESAAVRQPIVGDNGNWWTWDPEAGAYADTGIYSGGDAPYIGANGNWYVGQTDTGVAAAGPAGPPGPAGPAGPQGPAGPALAVTNTAAVGQTIKVSAVDENGQPTEWEAVDMGGAGGVSEWVKLFDITTFEDVMSIEQTLDFACDELLIVFSDLLSVTGNGIGVGVSINGYSAGSTKHGMLAGAFVHTTAQSRGVVQVFKAESMWYSIISGINSGGNSNGNGISRPSGGNGKTRIEEFCIWLSTPMTNSIKAGSKFAIYGR